MRPTVIARRPSDAEPGPADLSPFGAATPLHCPTPLRRIAAGLPLREGIHGSPFTFLLRNNAREVGEGVSSNDCWYRSLPTADC